MPWKERYTMDLKQEFVLKAMAANCNFRQLCSEYGISKVTGYKWKKRFIEKGINGLYEKSRKPHKTPNETTEDILCKLIRLKTHHRHWGAVKIRKVFMNHHPEEKAPSVTTVNRIFEKAGLVQKRKRRKVSESLRLQNRFVPAKPNELWTVDFKGWWYTSEKDKVNPLTVRDEYSKYILSLKALDKGDTKAVRSEFERLFRAYGLPKVIRSDNGPPFAAMRGLLGLTQLSVWWLSLGIGLDRIEPGKPYQNGSHERMHLDIKRELQGEIPGGLRAQQAAFDVWKAEYNTERPHQALNLETPAAVYRKSPRAYSESEPQIAYPPGFDTRAVQNRGVIIFEKHSIFISYAFKGFRVGLSIEDENTVGVWFDNLRLGHIDLISMAFFPVKN